ncbi:MAG TPA: biosynthetic peptidoglycan transglycosylase [Bacteriovoracaceae bacterium]|nr:biosynthetic peptidoglycan transglycosylase [Bacteriovoracaceae bacterium]
MKAPLKSALIRYLLVLSTLAVLFTPLYMYFSDDVAKLNSQWPHLVEKSEPAEYIVKKGQPKSWVTLKQISNFGKWAIVLCEDWAFYEHEGIDIKQMKAAINDMMTDKRFRGASTITQQMVKNVFLSNDRSLWRKVHELILSHKVENVLTKDRILEVYLNVIEFGPSIYGIKNASYHYFKKHPSNLSPREGAFLAMLLPSPKRYYVSFQKKKLTPFALSRIIAILGKLRMGKYISHERYEKEKISLMSWER